MRIRLLDDGIDRFKVFLPEKDENFPIGVVWKDPFSKRAWKNKAYFSLSSSDKHIESKTYDDFMKAARELAIYYERSMFFSSLENEDLFENPYNFSWDDASD